MSYGDAPVTYSTAKTNQFTLPESTLNRYSTPTIPHVTLSRLGRLETAPLEFILPQLTEFAEDSDADLLGYMAMQAEDRHTATLAYGEFYRRHVRWLYGHLMKAEARHLLGGAEGVREFVHDTFQKAFEAAGTFDPVGIKDANRLRNRSRAWLGCIGRRLLMDGVRTGAPGAYEQSLGEIEPSAPAEEGELLSEELNVMRDLLDGLTPREKDILLDWTLHYRPGAAHQRLPNEASSALTKRWDTTQANIRVIRKRTFDNLKEEFIRRTAGSRKPKS